MSTHTIQAASPTDALTWLFRKLGVLPRALVRWHQYRSVRAELAHMDPHLLQDIGIEPDRVDAVAAQIAANQNDWRGAA